MNQRTVLLCVLCACIFALFVGPAWLRLGGYPVPLDDVYIHFDHARAWAEGAPQQWIAGQGYSSGETSPLYAALLGVAYALGFHDRALGLAAALIAFASCVVALGQMGQLQPRLGAKRARIGTEVGLVLGCGVLMWTLASGMEGALFIALTMRALVVAKRVRRARHGSASHLAVLGMLLCLTRPEAPALLCPIILYASGGVGDSAQYGQPPALRKRGATAIVLGLPALVTTALVLLINRGLTGEFASAGAIAKLLTASPRLTHAQVLAQYMQNTVDFFRRPFAYETLQNPVLGSLILLGCWRALAATRTLTIARTLALAALLWVAMISTNSAASFQNHRYAMPAIALVLALASLGLNPLLDKTFAPRARPWALASLLILSGLGLTRQARFFARASANIEQQQVQVGLRLGRIMRENDSVLLGDAGAIPYFSRRHAIDVIGLGAYHAQPFARAAVLGEGAIVELLKGMPDAERPRYFALYPSWFPFITGTFGHPFDHVTAIDNVICGADTKVLYRADYTFFSDPGAPTSHAQLWLDIGNLQSERHTSARFRGSAKTRIDGLILHPEHTRAFFDGGRPFETGASLQLENAMHDAHAPWLVRGVGSCEQLLRGSAPATSVVYDRDILYVHYAEGAAELNAVAADIHCEVTALYIDR